MNNCDFTTVIEEISAPDADGNVKVYNSYGKSLLNYNNIIKWNNKVFAWNDVDFYWEDISNPNILISITKSDTTVNQQYIWNSPDNILYLGTSNGLYTSSNDGTIWNFITGTESLNIILIHGNSNFLFLVTNDNGLWQYNLTTKVFSQIKNKQINPNSVFLSNDDKNLFYGIENEGLYEFPGLDVDSSEQLIGNNELIKNATNIKSIKETKNDSLLVLTNDDIIKCN